jgi:transcriptional regulator with XRE-family HTH domain
MRALSTARLRPERFTQARIARELTQEALAAEVGCSVFSIAKYERGERTPSIGMLRRIAAVTGYEIGWFFDEAEVA